MSDLQILAREITRYPDIRGARFAYADLLDEHGRFASATRQRIVADPDNRELRQHYEYLVDRLDPDVAQFHDMILDEFCGSWENWARDSGGLLLWNPIRKIVFDDYPLVEAVAAGGRPAFPDWTARFSSKHRWFPWWTFAELGLTEAEWPGSKDPIISALLRKTYPTIREFELP